VDATAVSQIIARGEGVPARLADLVRRVARGEKVSASPISAREVVVDRMARLTSSQRRLLFVIALIDRPCERDLAGAAAHLPAAAVNDTVDALREEDLVTLRADGRFEIGAETSGAALELAGPSTRAFLSGWIADELASRSRPAGELARFYAAAGQSRMAFEKSRLAAFDALALGAVPEATHHLQVARSFAPSAEDEAAIESMLNAVGAGLRQIPLSRTDASRTDRAPADPASAAPSQPPGRIAALFPHWRMLLGAAVATLTISAIILADRSRTASTVAGLPTTDTLIVAEDDAHRILRTVTGDMTRGFVISARHATAPGNPAWIDSLTRSWTNPMTAPRGQRVALERVTAAGSDLLIVGADRRDTTAVAVDVGDAHALGWSPDGRWLLASLAPSRGSFDAQLVAFHDNGVGVDRRAIDAAPGRSVVEAAWSPDGTRIAWVSRVGVERQLEVFVSDADGRNVRNVSRHPADDQHIAWSPDGRLLAFTSARDGNAELYALSFLETRLWRLTFDAAQDDAARFSSDSRLVAFESTRGGAAAVYVMPALGGDVRRVQSAANLSVVRWIGRPSRYIDRVLVEQPQRVRRGDTGSLRLLAFDQFDEPIDAAGAQWRVLDSLSLTRVSDPDSDELTVVARSDGIARIAGSVGGWRGDTALVALGNGTIALLQGEQPGFWRMLGAPRPVVAGEGVVLLSDREWDSGILSRRAIPLTPGLVLQTSLTAPTRDSHDPAATVSIALVAPEDSGNIDVQAPQFLRQASLSWNAEAGRFIYAVGREVFSELAASVATDGSALPIRMRIEADSTMSFHVGGQLRWRSSLRVLSHRHAARAQVWISSRATGDRVRVRNATIRLEPR
jgi:Tol biopolymer transport system component